MNEQEIAKAVERILADLQTCIKAVETMRPIVSDAILLKKFDNTFSAHVVTGLQDILCRYVVLTLCRMWDEDKNSQSIPSVSNILTILNDPTKATHQRIDQLNRLVNRMRKSRRLKRLRNWRDKNLGHALLESRREKKKGRIEDPKWDDIFALERRSCVIVEAVASAADIAIDSAGQRQIYSGYAQAFWRSFVDRPR
jgi:hypothetical protein